MSLHPFIHSNKNIHSPSVNHKMNNIQLLIKKKLLNIKNLMNFH